MLFARPSRTKIQNGDDITKQGDDVSVYPLAIPMLCGPGNIAALLMFSSQVYEDAIMLIAIILISTSIFIIAMIVMFFCVYIEKILGETGISVIHRIMGLILSAMAVQFILNGIKQTGFIE